MSGVAVEGNTRTPRLRVVLSNIRLASLIIERMRSDGYTDQEIIDEIEFDDALQAAQFGNAGDAPRSTSLALDLLKRRPG